MKVRKKRFKFAKVAFSDAEGLRAFVDAANGADGIYLGSNRIQIVREQMVCYISVSVMMHLVFRDVVHLNIQSERDRKIRRLVDELMIM